VLGKNPSTADYCLTLAAGNGRVCQIYLKLYFLAYNSMGATYFGGVSHMLFSCVNPNIVAISKAELAREEQSLADLPIRQRGEQNFRNYGAISRKFRCRQVGIKTASSF